MINKSNILDRKQQLSMALISLLIVSQQAAICYAEDDQNKHSQTTLVHNDDAIAPELNPKTPSTDNGKSYILRGKAEVTRQSDNNLQAWQASQIYKQGVGALSAQRFALATQYFKLAGDGFATAGNNEKFLAEARYAEAQSRRLLGQKQLATPLYQEAISLFREYDPLSPYLQAALDNLKAITPPPLQAHATKTDVRLKALVNTASIQTVDKNIILKGRATDSDTGLLRSEKGTSTVTEAHIKKTVLQAFVKMTCIETTELGSTYFNAVDKYIPLKADGKNVAVSASSGFNAPIINIKLNGRCYNVGVDLPELSGSRRTVYLVTDGKNILAIDPATYDVWKLYAKLGKHAADFDWRKLTHQKDLPKRINPEP